MNMLATMTIMSLLAGGLLLIPFMRLGTGLSGGSSAAIRNARQQMEELQREADAGMIGEGEVLLARREIEARVLAAAKEGETTVINGSDKVRLIGVGIVVGWVTVGSAVLYTFVGSPTLPGSRPTAAMQALPPATQPVTPVVSGASQTVGSVDDMITKLSTRLAETPDDAEGWRMLGWSYFQTENYFGAVNAYAKAVELDATDPVILSVYGEAVVRSEEGQVSDRALGIFHQALALDPSDPRARFFQGMALEQRGDPKGAVTLWLEILETAPRDADWAPGLRDRISELAPTAGIDLAAQPEWQNARDPAAAAAKDQFRGPSPDEVAAAEQLSAVDRQAMILGMVEGLASRLEDDPNDIEGWARLIRSYTVMNDMAAAKGALDRAAELLGPGSAVYGAIAITASELGIK